MTKEFKKITAKEAEQWVAKQLAEVLLIQFGILEKPYTAYEETSNEKK